ncbi:ROK family transcriptional regulator [Streptosporangium sp. NBC_01755]|uniref:ROK family transcriptional regulator n=1 Tax=unclassified Streptosporangium TaxID=2632669 RepID=UPI002DDA6C62|nr:MULTISPECIES: ROK family transcriptional regulator [unclassified Streptosporangium]WSA25023.1 ROK family transcriptional regulator [Streptosporangium sp. NBC_01810]WSD03646.1 ROK family transcriptional regulator [Streptosporangium sp. NBC_01755]
MTQAVRHDSMRARNLGVILGEIRRNGPVTRAALAEITGLTKTTVSKMVGDLIKAGMVTESGALRDGERGRPGTAVVLSGRRVAALGLEINVDHLSACVVDLTLAVRLRYAQAVDNHAASPVETLSNLAKLARRAVDEARRDSLYIAGTTLAVPGPVDGGLVHTAPNLGWHDVRVSDLLDFPVEVDNEANLAALGELWFGSAPGDFLHVSGEIGIGAGLVVDGTLFRGARGLAGELGHVVVHPDGPACRCGGRGCLEQYAGQEALLRACGLTGIPELLKSLRAGEPDALEACERAGQALGIALTSAVNLMDPGMIVLGGIFAPLFPWIRDPAHRTMTARLGAMRQAVPELSVSRLGGDAATLGAAGQVIHQVINAPIATLARI